VTEPGRAVFLSYASQDAEAALQLCNALREAGVEVWFDQSELRGGDAWDASIRRQIKACALFVPIISRHTHARDEGYFRLEWKLAVDRSHLMVADRPFLLPVVIDDISDQDEKVPDRFREVQWTRLPGGRDAEAFAERVRRLVSPEAPAPGAQSAPSLVLLPASADAVSTRSMPSASRSYVPWIVGSLLVLATGYLLADKFLASRPPSPVAHARAPVTTLAEAASDRSIAVLPFVDMSEKKDQEYFSDGLAETLLDLLAKTPGLHVIARTSSFSFKGKSVDIPTIANVLHVANILEGSVRKSGNHLRVTTQLIRAADGEHLWSETYDREMADVFKIQDDIATAVVAVLKLKLAPGQRAAAQRTSNTEAYNKYLLGNQFYNRANFEGFNRAVQAYQKAIALDPQYAAAYAGLAPAEYFSSEGDADAAAAATARAGAAANKAIALAPDDGAGYNARSFLRMAADFDWQGAVTDAEKAVALDPGESKFYLGYGTALLAVRRVSEANAALRKSVQLDPLSTNGWLELGRADLAARNLSAAQESLRHALEISPTTSMGLDYMGRVQMIEGRPAEALATFREISGADAMLLTGVSMAEHSLGHGQESRAALDELVSRFSGVCAYQVAEVHAWRGAKDLAFEWLDRAFAQRDGGFAFLMTDPLMDPLRSDPRFKVLLHKLKLPE